MECFPAFDFHDCYFQISFQQHIIGKVRLPVQLGRGITKGAQEKAFKNSLNVSLRQAAAIDQVPVGGASEVEELRPLLPQRVLGFNFFLVVKQHTSEK